MLVVYLLDLAVHDCTRTFTSGFPLAYPLNGGTISESSALSTRRFSVLLLANSVVPFSNKMKAYKNVTLTFSRIKNLPGFLKVRNINCITLYSQNMNILDVILLRNIKRSYKHRLIIGDKLTMIYCHSTASC